MSDIHHIILNIDIRHIIDIFTGIVKHHRNVCSGATISNSSLDCDESTYGLFMGVFGDRIGVELAMLLSSI